MYKENNKYRSIKIVVIVVLLLIAALFVGWLVGRSTNDSSKDNGDVSTQPSSANQSNRKNDIKSIVSYLLPDGWEEKSCPNTKEVVYIVPNNASFNCSANPSSPIKIYVDRQYITDCQQLNSPQDVRKHVCISLYIDGHKSLKASTEYPKSSTYKTDTTISDYYIDTGKGVVKVEYTYTSNNDYQIGYDQLAMSVKVK